MGSEIGHFCLLTVHREWVGGLDNLQKHAYIVFEWSFIQCTYVKPVKIRSLQTFLDYSDL